MRKNSQPWLVPLIVLVGIFWLFGEKAPPPPQFSPGTQISTAALVSSASPEVQLSDLARPALSEQFVNTNKLNQRDRPDGKVISSLARGARVQVYERQKEWVRVSPDETPALWLSAKHLCSGVGCSKQVEPERVSQLPKRSSRSSPSYGSSCPCSSGNVCIGPRGGRYCITSGGNKRYGV